LEELDEKSSEELQKLRDYEIEENEEKKRTIKKRPKSILVESSDELKDPSAEKIFNPLTKRYVKNTKSNRKKIEQQTLKHGGKSKKRSRKNKGK
jgi:hypothetical protein